MTDQLSERLVIGSQTLDLASYPLESYWKQYGPRPDFEQSCTAIHRGYVGTWSIEDGTLYLTDLSAATLLLPFSRGELATAAEKSLEHLLWAQRTLNEVTPRSTLELINGRDAFFYGERRVLEPLARSIEATFGRNHLDTPMGTQEWQQVLESVQVEKVLQPSDGRVTVETLFPGSGGKMPATWFSGILPCPLGKPVYDKEDVFEEFACFLQARQIEVAMGHVIADQVVEGVWRLVWSAMPGLHDCTLQPEKALTQ